MNFNKLALFGAFFFVAILAACSNNTEKTIDPESKKYEQSKDDLANIEKKKPVKYLTVNFTDKKNLLGQTVVKGTITNNAKMVTFKDVEVKYSFFSKTQTLIGQDIETIYDSIPPGNNATFKSKKFAPKQTDSVAAEILSAKF